MEFYDVLFMKFKQCGSDYAWHSLFQSHRNRYLNLHETGILFVSLDIQKDHGVIELKCYFSKTSLLAAAHNGHVDVCHYFCNGK